MIELIIKNSSCQVKNSNSELDTQLSELLQYTNSQAEYAFQNLIKNIQKIERNNRLLRQEPMGQDLKDLKRMRFMLHKLDKDRQVLLYQNGEFLTGLLPRVINFLNEESIPFRLIDERKQPTLNTEKLIPIKSFPILRYYQKRAIKSALENHRGVIVAATGTGKTLTICKLIDELRIPTLVITPSKNITTMMVKTITEYFGKGKVAKLTTKAVKLKAINIVNIQAIARMNPKIFEGIQAVFIDEFHHSSADTYLEVNKEHLKNCYYKIGVTATNFRADGSDLALEGVLSEVLDTYDTLTAIKDRFLTPPEFTIITNENPQEGKYQTQYSNGIVNNKERNRLIAEIANDYKDDRHILILVKEIEHGQNILKLLPDAKFINGTEKESLIEKTMNEFKEGKLKILIASSILGEGVDLPIADMLIMAAGGKSPIQVIQNIGRVLRLYTGKNEALVFDFEDLGAEYLNRHALERQDIYQTFIQDS